MEKAALIDQIKEWKKTRGALVVAHNYQIDDIQDIADIVGDSLALSIACAKAENEVIVFCGVHFMAESAKILSPEKTILLPEKQAGCPMADMVTAEALRAKKLLHPGAATVCYINSSAEVKAECDICCTSSNAVAIIGGLPEKDILFVPDQNLAAYVASKLPDKNIIPWEGYCVTHHRIRAEDVNKAKNAHPDAVLLVHPECRPEVTALADFVGSTRQIIDHAAASSDRKFIIGTEMGVLHKLKRDNPGKTFYLLSPGLVCPNMKKTTLNSLYESLRDMKYRIELSAEVIAAARGCLERMLQRTG